MNSGIAAISKRETPKKQAPKTKSQIPNKPL